MPVAGPILYDGGQGPGPGQHIQDKFASSESPKLKFNFFIKFEFRSNSPPGQSLGGLTLESNYLAAKTSGRITPIINYKDVSYYGYRTKVATRTDFSVLNVTLYDDASQRSHSIIDAYMNAVSPLANAPGADAVRGLSTIGALENGSALGVIKKITLWHVAIGGDKKTQYEFYNPKITNIIADELDMTASDVSTINMAFVYDGYKVQHF